MWCGRLELAFAKRLAFAIFFGADCFPEIKAFCKRKRKNEPVDPFMFRLAQVLQFA